MELENDVTTADSEMARPENVTTQQRKMPRRTRSFDEIIEDQIENQTQFHLVGIIRSKTTK